MNGILSIAATIGTALGLIAFMWALYVRNVVSVREESLRKTLAGTGIVNPDVVVKILAQFTDESQRLKALHKMLGYDVELSTSVIDKVKNNIDLHKIDLARQKKHIRVLIIVGTVMLLISIIAFGFDKSRSTNPAEVIVYLENGFRTSQDLYVRGRAILGDKEHLWLFVQPEKYDGVWWPQDEVAIDPWSHEWGRHVALGRPEDVGCRFYIAATVLDDIENRRMRKYLEDGRARNDFPPILMPATKMAPQIRWVFKMKHIGGPDLPSNCG